MNWADGFWRYDVAEIARELERLRVPADQVRDAHGNSLLALAVKYADPGEPLKTVAMLDMLFRGGCQWHREPEGRNLIVYARECKLDPPVVDALLAWFYQQRSQHYSSCRYQHHGGGGCSHWGDLDHEALEWTCQYFGGSDALHLLNTVVANNSDNPGLPLRALRAAIVSKDEDWALVVARHPGVELAVRSIGISTVCQFINARDCTAPAPAALQWFVRCVESAIHGGMETVSAHLDRLNHRATGLASAFYVHVVAKTHATTSSSSSSESSSSSDSPPSRRRSLTRIRSRRTGGLFVAALARQFRRDVAWGHVRLLVMARHRALVQDTREPACLCRSEHGGGRSDCTRSYSVHEEQERAHPLLTAPDSVFALILAFVPASAAVQETLEAFGRWSRWRPRRSRARKRSLKQCR